MLLLIGKRCFDKSVKQRMAFVWSLFKFRMCLCCHKPRMVGQFDHFDDASVRLNTAQFHAVFNTFCTVVIIEFITVAVSFGDFFLSVKLISLGVFGKNTFI